LSAPPAANGGQAWTSWKRIAVRKHMQADSTQSPTVGYIVSTWPRLSATFILNEVIAVERSGVSLPLRGHWKSALQANLRLFCRQPGRYCRALLQALRYRRWDVLQRFFQAGYLAHETVGGTGGASSCPLRPCPGAGRHVQPPTDRHSLYLHGASGSLPTGRGQGNTDREVKGDGRP
jgi:hypothetical protein